MQYFFRADKFNGERRFWHGEKFLRNPPRVRIRGFVRRALICGSGGQFLFIQGLRGVLVFFLCPVRVFRGVRACGLCGARVHALSCAGGGSRPPGVFGILGGVLCALGFPVRLLGAGRISAVDARAFCGVFGGLARAVFRVRGVYYARGARPQGVGDVRAFGGCVRVFLRGGNRDVFARGVRVRCAGVCRSRALALRGKVFSGGR